MPGKRRCGSRDRNRWQVCRRTLESWNTKWVPAFWLIAGPFWIPELRATRLVVRGQISVTEMRDRVVLNASC